MLDFTILLTWLWNNNARTPPSSSRIRQIVSVYMNCGPKAIRGGDRIRHILTSEEAAVVSSVKTRLWTVYSPLSVVLNYPWVKPRRRWMKRQTSQSPGGWGWWPVPGTLPPESCSAVSPPQHRCQQPGWSHLSAGTTNSIRSKEKSVPTAAPFPPAGAFIIHQEYEGKRNPNFPRKYLDFPEWQQCGPGGHAAPTHTIIILSGTKIFVVHICPLNKSPGFLRRILCRTHAA